MKINKFFIAGFFICVIFFWVENVHSKAMGINKYLENVQIPPEMEKATTVSEVKPFLDSSDERIRILAVRKIGQIRDKNAVGLLAEVFEREHYEAGMETFAYVKTEIIDALEKIGGDESKSALFKILEQYLKRGPRVKERIDARIWEDAEYSGVTRRTPKILYRFYDLKQDTEIYKLFKKIALNELKDWWIKQDRNLQIIAYKVYLKTEFLKKNLTKEQIKKYLEKEVKKYRHKSFNSIEGFKIEAISDLLGELSINISNE